MTERKQGYPIPLTLYTHHASLSTWHDARQSLQTSLADLEHDWEKRDKAFWEQTLQALQAIKHVVSPLLTVTQEPRHIVKLGYVHSQIDDIGILITVHSQARRSPLEAQLRQRHQILTQLRHLMGLLNDLHLDNPGECE